MDDLPPLCDNLICIERAVYVWTWVHSDRTRHLCADCVGEYLEINIMNTRPVRPEFTVEFLADVQA